MEVTEELIPDSEDLKDIMQLQLKAQAATIAGNLSAHILGHFLSDKLDVEKQMKAVAYTACEATDAIMVHYFGRDWNK